MSIPRYHINSITYSVGSLTINSDYFHLADGGSFSVVGFPQTLYFSITNSSAIGYSATYAISISVSTIYNLTFSFYKAPYTNYPFDQPQGIGLTQGNSLLNGAIPYNTGIYNPGGYSTLYQVNRIVSTYSYSA